MIKMAEYQDSGAVVIKPGEPIPIYEPQKKILEALQKNAKTDQQGYDVYVKLYKSIQCRYGDVPCKEDLTLATMTFYKEILQLTKEEAQIAVGAGYDL